MGPCWEALGALGRAGGNQGRGHQGVVGHREGLCPWCGATGACPYPCPCPWRVPRVSPGSVFDATRVPGARHALDIREHYERKLERANNLYMELSALMLQLELKEKELLRWVGSTPK